MNKKILVLIIATILAFFSCYLFLKINTKTEKFSIEENTKPELNIENIKNNDKTNVNNKTKNNIKSDKKQIEIIKNESKDLQKESEIKLNLNQTDEITKSEEIVIKNNEIKPDIIKEIDSNTIVITREFKIQSPAKYSFK